jgi:hypothetical protein
MGAITIMTATWIMIRWIDKRTWRTAGFALGHSISNLVVGLGIGIGMITISVASLWLSGSIQFLTGVTISAPVLMVTGAAMLFNAVTQEVLVRGYLFQTIQSQGSSKLALILTAFIFSIMHGGGGAILPAINLFMVGILLGLGYVWTGNLWLSIALHFGWNFLLGPVLGLTVSGQALDSGWRIMQLQGATWVTGGSFGLEGGLAATISTIIGILVLSFLFRRKAA